MIPASLFEVPTIETIYFDNNQFSLTIPANYGESATLRELWLNDNNLVGEIPPIQDITASSLQIMRFDSTMLTGTMPESVCNLPELATLTADCSEPNPEVVCECCTTCF